MPPKIQPLLHTPPPCSNTRHTEFLIYIQIYGYEIAECNRFVLDSPLPEFGPASAQAPLGWQRANLIVAPQLPYSCMCNKVMQWKQLHVCMHCITICNSSPLPLSTEMWEEKSYKLTLFYHKSHWGRLHFITVLQLIFNIFKHTKFLGVWEGHQFLQAYGSQSASRKWTGRSESFNFLEIFGYDWTT